MLVTLPDTKTWFFMHSHTQTLLVSDSFHWGILSVIIYNDIWEGLRFWQAVKGPWECALWVKISQGGCIYAHHLTGMVTKKWNLIWLRYVWVHVCVLLCVYFHVFLGQGTSKQLSSSFFLPIQFNPIIQAVFVRPRWFPLCASCIWLSVDVPQLVFSV